MALSRIKSKDELYELRKGCSTHKLENLEPAIGTSFIIYSPFSKTEYHSEIREYTDWKILQNYIDDGNCYK